MAFCCVLYLKAECDGCGVCEEVRRARALCDEEGMLSDWGVIGEEGAAQE